MSADAKKEWKLGSAVVDGEIRYFSVSQLQAFASCERLWWWDKVKKQPKKQSKAQQTGTEAHKQWAHYLRTGEDVLGELARIALPALPQPGPDLLVEQEFCPTDVYGGEQQSVVRAAGIPLVGDVDLVNARGLETFGPLRITDHKTSSDPAKWAAHEKYLRTVDLDAIRADADGAPGAGIQMIGYGIWALETFSGVELVDLEHIVTPTKYRKKDLASGLVKSTRVHAVVAPNEIRREWSKVDQIAERAKEVARSDTAPEPNWNACEKYGGCSFKQQCLTYQTKARPQMPNLMDMLNKSKTAAPVTPPPPPAPQAAAPAAAQEQKPFGTMKAGDCVEGTEYVLDADGTRGTADGSSKSTAFFTTKAGVAKLSTITMVEPVPAPVAAKPEPVKVENFPKQDTAAEDSTIPTPQVAAAVKAAVAESKTIAEAAAAPVEAKKTRPKKENATEVPGLSLFIDAVPNRPHESLAGYIAKIVGDIEKTFNVVDIRCAPKKLDDGKTDHPLAFGGWKGALRGAVIADPPKPGTYVLLGSSGSELAQIVIEALEPQASLFVRGV